MSGGGVTGQRQAVQQRHHRHHLWLYAQSALTGTWRRSVLLAEASLAVSAAAADFHPSSHHCNVTWHRI